MKIALKNIGETPIINQNVYIAAPPELNITNKTFPMFDLDPGEPFTIGELSDHSDEIIITPGSQRLTGKYDIIVFCNNKVIRNEITVKEGL